MVSSHSKHGQKAVQPPNVPKSGYGFLAVILDGVDDGPLLDVLQAYHWTGRKGYPAKAMLRACYAKFVLKIRYSNQFLERLRGSRRLREVCGFGDEVPSESAWSRFMDRLADHQDLLELCIVSITNQLQGQVPAVKKRKGKQDQPLPPLGTVLAVDSTLFETYSNPNRKVSSDPDARWGLKHSARSKDGKEVYGYGYKMHLISDATHGVPLAFIVTPANVSDTTILPDLVRKVLDTYPGMEPKVLLADRGYDSLENHEFLVGLGIIPVIHIRKPTAHDGLYDGLYNAEGKPLCMGQVPMDYIRTEPETGAHLFRCREGGCPLKKEGTKAVTHCDSEVWEAADANLRVLGPLPRFTEAWKRLYPHRMSIERTFRSLKHSRGLEGHCARGMRKIRLLATLSVLTYSATVLARLKAGDIDRMRQMTVKVA